MGEANPARVQVLGSDLNKTLREFGFELTAEQIRDELPRLADD